MIKTTLKHNSLSVPVVNFLGYFFKKQWLAFSSQLILSLAWSCKEILFAYFVKRLINLSQTTQIVTDQLLLTAFGLIAIWGLMELAMRIQGLIGVTAFPILRANVRHYLHQKILQKPYHFFTHLSNGNITNKILDATKATENLIEIACLHLPSIGSAILIGIFLLLSATYYFALIFLIWLLMHLATMLYFTKTCTKHSQRHAESHAQLSGKITDYLTNIYNAFLFQSVVEREHYIEAAQYYEIRQSKRSRWVLEKVKLYQSIYATCYIITMVCLLLYSWQQQVITSGDFALVPILSFNLIGMVSWLSYQVTIAFKDIGVLTAGLKLILPDKKLLEINDKMQNLTGDICIEKVSFSYATNNLIFDGLSLNIAAGEKIALIGPSGTGKSTLVNLLLGLNIPHKGQILVGGHDITNMSFDSLSNHITVVPQEILLLNASIFENIKQGNSKATYTDIKQAAKIANCDVFIGNFEKAYNTLVGERGVKLSGGQRQRIAIARAILKNSPILIFDEASSALDIDTENHIFQNILTEMKGKTVIIITHRETILPYIDRILYLEKGGKILEKNLNIKNNVHDALLVT